MSTGIEYSIKASGGIGNPKRFGKEKTLSDNECKKCGNLMSLRDGCDPTEYCDLCAQDLVIELQAEIKKLEKKNFGLVTALLGTFIRGPSDYFFCPRCGNAAGKHAPQCPVGDAIANSK